MIFVRHNLVSGLTTAAGVWTTAGIGLAAGAGMYGIAVYATVILLIVQIVIHKILPVENTSTTSVTMKLIDDADAVEVVSKIFKDNGYTLISNSVEKRHEKYACLFTIRAKSHINPDEITNLFSGNEYVISISV